jgi:hypothetical protein
MASDASQLAHHMQYDFLGRTHKYRVVNFHGLRLSSSAVVKGLKYPQSGVAYHECRSLSDKLGLYPSTTLTGITRAPAYSLPTT